MKTYQEKYLKYKLKYIKLKSTLQYNKQIGGSSKTLTLIKAEWCGWCKKFKPIWDELPQHIPGITFKILDEKQNKAEVADYDVTGFPSIFLEKDNKVIPYDGARTIDDIKKFVEQN